jgi:hypothetical protein
MHEIVPAYRIGALIWSSSADRKRAIQFLKRANGEGDYPEAASTLAQLTARVELTPSARLANKDS